MDYTNSAEIRKLQYELNKKHIPMIGYAPNKYDTIKRRSTNLNGILLLTNPITQTKIFNVCLDTLRNNYDNETSDDYKNEDISNLKILIVDKMKNNRKLLYSIVKNLNCKNVTAMSTAKKINNYDVVILNIAKLDAFSTKLIKRCTTESNKKIYIMGIYGSHNIDSHKKNRMYKMGVDIILEPPIKSKNIEDVLKIISKKINGK